MEAVGHRTKQGGFSLIESAIVLAVVGLVVAGIWVAAASIHHKMQINEAEKLVLMVAQGIYNKIPLSLSGGVSGWVDVDGYFLLSANIVPSDTTVKSNRIVDPWGQTMIIGLNVNGGINGGSPYIAIGFQNVPFERCQSLIMTIAFRVNDKNFLIGGGSSSMAFYPFQRTADNIYCVDSLQSVYFLFNARP